METKRTSEKNYQAQIFRRISISSTPPWALLLRSPRP